MPEPTDQLLLALARWVLERKDFPPSDLRHDLEKAYKTVMRAQEYPDAAR